MRAKFATLLAFTLSASISHAARITSAGNPARLDIRPAGAHGLRLTLRPLSFEAEVPYSPVLTPLDVPAAFISLREIDQPVRKRVGSFQIEALPDPLRIKVTDVEGRLIQDLVFDAEGGLSFAVGEAPILGLGEGGPQPGPDWRSQPVEFDRRGRLHAMRPRWQANAYGSRNPVALMIGTEGWAMYIASPWGEIDLRDKSRGRFMPWPPPDPPELTGDQEEDERRRRRYTARVQGRPPLDSLHPGVYDLFVFDAHNPAQFMKDLSLLTGPAVMPPKWALGYMQSHRTLEDDHQMVEIVRMFREKRFPLDSVVYLGTGFCPQGWNTEQPSFAFNPEVFTSEPAEVIRTLHDLHVRIVVHIVPWRRDRLATLHGTIPPGPGETVDASHILSYWREHLGLVEAGIDAWWPDEGDWFDLYERIKRHQLYYQGPLFSQPDIRPWSLHRNGHLGVARWGGWVWSGDTDSAWKTLEAQIAVGINHSLSLSPYWGSDIGGFYPNEELTGELYVRWFQFGAFCPSFRSHGRTWWMRLPWGWGLTEMGPKENRNNPLITELNNPAVEAVCRQYAELRYQLMPYTYTLAWEARDSGLPLMRALWLHYPNDPHVRGLGSQYLWGRDLLIAPVFEPGAKSRDVYLPHGTWYDWWTLEPEEGGRPVARSVNLSKIPIYVRAGAIIPLDPVRQYTAQNVDEPTTLRIFTGADGRFTLYEDDGLSLDYLEGDSTRTQITWIDSRHELTLEPADSGERGRPSAERLFDVELIPEGVAERIIYKGRTSVIIGR